MAITQKARSGCFSSKKNNNLEKHPHETEDLDLLDLSDVADLLSDLANVKGIIVSSSLGLRVDLGRVLPSLQNEQNEELARCETNTLDARFRKRTWGKAPVEEMGLRTSC